MRLNFITRYFDIAGGLGSATPVGAAAAATQTALGIVQTIMSDAKLKKLLARRKTYQTPEEYFKILQATQNRAQQGYDPFTLNFLTGSIDRAFSGAAGAATRLGANPNDLSAMFDQKMLGLMKVGAENHNLNMANFSRYLGALDVLGQNKVAEFNSEQDLIKDQMQAAAANKAAGVQNIGSGVNAAIGISSANETSNLYKQIADALAALKRAGGGISAVSAGSGADNSFYESVANSALGLN